MNSLVILNLGKGNCYDGLPHITARLVRQHEAASQMQYTGSLPSVPEIPQLYNHWQQLYKALHKALRKRLSTRSSIEFDDTVPTNVSEDEFRYIGEQLQKHIDNWLNSSGFRTIDQQLRTQLDPKETVRFIIETEDPFLQKLPWHLWCFFEHYQKSEIAISAKEYQQVPVVPGNSVSRQMRILVVLGHSHGLDVEHDRLILEKTTAKTVVLTEPKRSTLDKYLRDNLGWDIFFFAGHSTSNAPDALGEVRDQLSLNACEKLSISELKYAFKDAIEKGLKLAIFNSCDGLGLARQLVDWNLPQLIAMREPVVDQVAHAFLKHFLQDFAHGGPFYASVRYARERLQGMEGDYPGASWLPIIYQNPTAGTFVWHTLQPTQPVIPQRRSTDYLRDKGGKLRRLILPVMLAMVLMVTGLRSLGWLQSAELDAYDALVRSRPVGADISEIDDRLLVVEITAEDTDKYAYPIHDDRLAEALTKLRQHDPVAIGVDLHRYQANGEGREQLLQQFEEFPDLITVCSFGFGDRELLSHPPEFSLEQAQNQVGFSDLETDALFQPGKSVVRRQLLSYDVNLAEESSDCVTSYSFGLNLALRYLLTQGVQPLRANGSNWLLGDVEFKRLSAQTGAYQALDGQINQMLLNYRFRPKPAIRASLEDVLAEKVADNEIRDRIVLIGVVDPFGGDLRQTPFGELPGVWIHTHAVSNILSAVLDQRSLLWVLPQWGRFQWGDLLWLWLWAGVGGLLVWWVKSLPLLALSLLVACWGLRQLCLFILIQGGWVPLIPALLALVGTAVILLARKHGFLPLESLSEQLNIKRCLPDTSQMPPLISQIRHRIDRIRENQIWS